MAVIVFTEKRGGARPGCGRPKTGSKTRHYTVNFTIDEAEELEKRAAQMKMTVNKYLHYLVTTGGQYGSVGVSGKHVDETKKSRFIDEVITEKTYAVEENGQKGMVCETHIRRWIQGEENEAATELLAADRDTPYVVERKTEDK